MDTIKKKIGNNLKKLRTKKGLKQSELAELVGVEDKTISRIEVGGNYPSMDLLVRLAEALNCELVDFVNFSDKIIDSINELSKDDLKVLEKFVFLLKDKI
ncbi:transcriptional regulator XRE family [Fusobacterium sp. CAG:439]|nr:transcriptional regulator XRE family [Fusobacterium sp. CAG:439]